PAGTSLEPGARAVEPLDELAEVRHDEAGGDARGRGAGVRDEVAQRRVLLVTDGGDDRHRAPGDRPHDPLVAEGEKVLEAAAASREHDHVDVGLAPTRPHGLAERTRGARALDARP